MDRRDRSLRLAIADWMAHRPNFSGASPAIAANKMMRDFLSVHPEHSDSGREVILDRIAECAGFHSIEAMLARSNFVNMATIYLEQRDPHFV